MRGVTPQLEDPDFQAISERQFWGLGGCGLAG